MVYGYHFPSERKSHFVPGMSFFAIPSLTLSHLVLELSRINLQKIIRSILMEFVTISVVLVDQFYFNMHQPIKSWLCEKVIFQLDYHRASLCLHFHIVLKSPVKIFFRHSGGIPLEFHWSHGKLLVND